MTFKFENITISTVDVLRSRSFYQWSRPS